jgi:hypothetical protein
MTIETGPNRGPVLLPICWTLTSLSTIMVALRWHCRINYQARVWWDDYFMTTALVRPLGLCLRARADHFAGVCLGPEHYLDGVFTPRRNFVRADERAEYCHNGAPELDVAGLVYGRPGVRQDGCLGSDPAAAVAYEMAHDSPQGTVQHRRGMGYHRDHSYLRPMLAHAGALGLQRAWQVLEPEDCHI